MVESDQKSGGGTSLPLQIPNLHSLPAWAHSLFVVILILLGIIAGIYFLYLIYELGIAIFSTRDFEDARNIALILAALIGAPFVVWRVWTAHRQADIAAENQRIAEESHHADLFTKAIEQLAADKDVRILAEEDHWIHQTVANVEVRLGGIYALERLSHVSAAFHWSIMEVLTAYIRGNSPAGARKETSEGQPESPLSPPIGIDIQTAITVIGRRRPEDINRSKALGKRLDLERANLSKANLLGAKLSEALLSSAALAEAKLIKTNLSKANLRGADLRGANLNRTNLSRAYLNGADLSGAILEGVDLSGASMNGAKLRGADLSGIFETGADLSGASMYEADLSEAHLEYTNLSSAYLGRADLSWAHLSGAKLHGANLEGASLESADLTRADLTGAEIDQDQLDSASGSQETILPDGLSHPPHWLEQNSD